jgi:hypothetical protein
MGSMPVPIAFPDCGSDFWLGVTCGTVFGFAVATLFWICLHYVTRR